VAVILMAAEARRKIAKILNRNPLDVRSTPPSDIFDKPDQ